MEEFASGAVCGADGCRVVTEDQDAQPVSGAASPAVLDLTIVSDAICPWCYVGKRRLEKALAMIGPALNVRVTWRPYELNPHMPKEGMDRKAYRSRKFGSWEHSQKVFAQPG